MLEILWSNLLYILSPATAELHKQGNGLQIFQTAFLMSVFAVADG